MRHNEGQGKVQHAPDIVRASTTEPISALRSTIGSLWSAGCAWPRDRLNPDAASRSVVDFDPRLVADAAECLSLGLQTRRARPKSFLRRPPRARRRPSEPSCYSSPGGAKRLCGRIASDEHEVAASKGLHNPLPRVVHARHVAEPAELPPRHVEVGRVEPEPARLLRVRSSVEMWCFHVCFRVTCIDEAKTVFTYGPGRGNFRSDGTPPRDNTPLRHGTQGRTSNYQLLLPALVLQVRVIIVRTGGQLLGPPGH